MLNNIYTEGEAGKYFFMMNEKMNQLLQEREAWKRSLEFFKQENALLKYRLSEMVDKSEGNDFLQTAEYFQNEFLKKDEWLQKLMHSLQSIQEETEGFKNMNQAENKLQTIQDDLRLQIGKFEHDFIRLSDDFNLKVLKSIN